MQKYCYGLLLIIGALLVFCNHDLSASPSGLNNIPTTDVVPTKILVLQDWVNAGKEKVPEYCTGFKYGLFRGIEVGIDGKVGCRNVGPATVQLKYQLPFGNDESRFKSLLGVANISANSKRVGRIDPYVALSYQLAPFRFHLGYSVQAHNDAVFAGLDKTFQLLQRDFTLRSDIKQIKNGHEVIGSFGFAYALPCNFVVESWASFP